MITKQGLVDILERILSFHAFYKCRHPFKWDSLVDQPQGVMVTSESGIIESYIQIQIFELLSMIVSQLLRKRGFGWKLHMSFCTSHTR
jgi:hypothetical protein